jgi:hypothetical protein
MASFSNLARLLLDNLGIRPALQWWDSVAATFKVVSDEDPMPVTLAGGGGGAMEVQLVDSGGNAVVYPDVTPVKGTLLATSDLTRAIASLAAAGNVTVVAAVVGQTTRIHKGVLSANLPTVITFYDGVTPIYGPIYMGGNSVVPLAFDSRPYMTSSANSAVVMNNSAAASVNFTADYVTSA